MIDEALVKIRTAVKDEVLASEQRMRLVIKDEVVTSEKRVLNEIGKFMEDQLIPQLEEKADKADIERLERKFDHFSAKVIEHDKTLNDIKAIPVIAHALKPKK